MDAGRLIRDERTRRSWTLRELADRAGVSVGTAQGAEFGLVASLESYARLTTALGLRPSLELADQRDRGRSGSRAGHEAGDLVHAAMGELEARALAGPGRTLAIDEPYQHYQFAGRADLLGGTARTCSTSRTAPASRTSRMRPARTTPRGSTWRDRWRNAWTSGPGAGAA